MGEVVAHGPMDPWTFSYSPALRLPIEPVMSFADWLLPLLLITPDDEHGRDPFETPLETHIVVPVTAPVH